MKKLIYLFLLLPFWVNAQIVNIPDANFKTNLLNSLNWNIARDINGQSIQVDINFDGQIQQSEALLVYELYLDGNSSITDLTGLNSFTNLKKFDFSGNSTNTNAFSTLNLSGLINLTSVSCTYNSSLQNLTVSDLPLLNYMYFYGSNVSTVNLSNLPSINYLSFHYTQLSSLTMTNCLSLVELNLAQSKIVNVDFAGYSNLNVITLAYCNFIQNIDLSGTAITQFGWVTLSDNPIPLVKLNNCLNLTSFYQGDTKFGIVEMANCPSLQQVSFQGTVQQIQSDLTSLDLSGALNLNSLKGNFPSLQNLYLKEVNNVATMLNFNSNPTIGVSFNNANLNYVCVNDDQITAVQNVFANAGYTDAVVGSYCSFVPSSTYNTIAGIVKLDSNNDGCDVNDLAMQHLKIKKSQINNETFTFSNHTGNYNFYTTELTEQQIEPLLENPSYFLVNPTSALVNFPIIDGSTFTQNFCIAANGVHPDVEIVIAPITPARPGFDAVYQIVYKNKGNQALSGNITFTYDDEVLDFVTASVLPDTQSFGLLNWNYQNLQPFENRSIYVTLNVNSPQETPAVNIGDELGFQVTIIPVIGDEMAEDNLFFYNQTVVGSYDPNDITCIEGDVVPPSEIGEYLHYIINFENTGTAEAENIVVKVEVDPTKFDIDSLQMLNTSHNAYIRQAGNKIEFIFQEVWLDTGGHGNVLLKIRSKNNLLEGDTVAKQANIYFDYNFPIETNMANTTFEVLSSGSFTIDESIIVFPNPTASIININCNNTIKTVELYDVQGRLLQTQIVDNATTSLDISNKTNGIYFAKITSEKGVKVEKISKE